MSQTLTVAIGQFAPKWRAREENLAQMIAMITEAGAAGAALIVFPEMSRPGYSPKPTTDDWDLLAETLPSPDSERLANAAAPYKMVVVYGTLEKSPTGAHNTVVWLEDEKLFRYRKTHIHWTENFTHGNSFPVFGSRLAPAGALICFDLAFPEAARTLARHGAQIIVAPSAVPLNFKKIIHRRVMARALDNQLFVIYCNHAGENYGGGSLIVSPSGDIILEAAEKPGIYVTSLEIEQVAYWRSFEPISHYRRDDIYQSDLRNST